MADPIERISKVKKIKTVADGMETAPFTPQLQPYSTVQKSTASVPPITTKPVLTNPVYRVMDAVVRYEKQSDGLLALDEVRLQKDFSEMLRLSEKEKVLMQEVSQKAQNVTYWSYIQDVASSITAAIGSVFGYSLLTTSSPVIGGVLITSGVLSITNIVFKYGEVWDWVAKRLMADNEEAQKKFIRLVPAAMGIVTTVMGAAGTAGAWYFSQFNNVNQLMAVMQTVTTTMDGAIQVGKAVADSKLRFSDSEFFALQSNILFLKMPIEKLMEGMEDLYKQISQVTSRAAEIVGNAVEGIQLAQQIV